MTAQFFPLGFIVYPAIYMFFIVLGTVIVRGKPHLMLGVVFLVSLFWILAYVLLSFLTYHGLLRAGG